MLFKSIGWMHEVHFQQTWGLGNCDKRRALDVDQLVWGCSWHNDDFFGENMVNIDFYLHDLD